MSYVRSSISDFSLANAYYAAATVTVYAADAYGARTTTLAPLYEAITGTAQLTNPQTLSSLGKFIRPVYVDRDVVAVVTGNNIETHETGVITTYAFTDYLVDPFTGDGTTTVFTLSRLCATASLLDVTVDGARQKPVSAYTVNGTTSLTFTEAPPAGAEIFVVHSATPAPLQPVRTGPAGPPGDGGFLTLAEYTGDGVTTVFSVLATVTTVMLAIDGVVQPASSYTLAGSTVICSEAPPNGSLVDIRAVSSSLTGVVLSSYTAPRTGAVARTVVSKLADIVSVKDLGAAGDGTTNDTTTLNAALALGIPLLVPPGVYIITAPLLASVAGAGLYGQGAEIRQTTATTPAIITSADKITIDGIYFNSSQAKTGSTAATPYRAGINYHSGVLQTAGDDLTVRNCRFYNWTAGIGYHGNEASSAVRAKNLRVLNNLFIKHDFGVLARQFDGCLIEGNFGRDCEETTPSGGPYNPAHLVYVTDRSGAMARGLTMVGNVEENNTSSSPYKARNVDGIVVSGNVARNCGRGIEIGSSRNVSITGNSVTAVQENTGDTQQSLITIDVCEFVTISGNTLNMGVSTIGKYGIRLRSDTNLMGNRFIEVTGNTVIGEWDAVNGAIAFYIEDQDDCVLVNNVFVNTGTGQVNYPYRVDTGCNRIKIISPIYQSVSGVTNADACVRIQAGATDTYIAYDNRLWPGATFSDLGTGTIIRRSDVILADDGSAAAPSLSFTSDPDCGLYRTGTNTIGMAINGALTMRFVGDRTEAYQPIRPSADLTINSGEAVLRWQYVHAGRIRLSDNVATPADGDLRYNSGTGKFQGRASGAWVDLH
jgi:hypothetical protein